MIKWIKQTGQEVETNENPANIAEAEKLGWKRGDAVEEVDDAPVDARGLPWDARINTKNQSQDSTGNWKLKQGVSAEDAAPVEQELYADMVDGA